MTHFAIALIARKAKLAAYAALAFAGFAYAGPAFAEPVSIASSILIERQFTEGGTTRSEWVVADKVVPGDILRFVFRYQNHEDTALNDFVINSPVPEAVKVRSIDPEQIVSVDNAKSFVRFDQAIFSDADGSTKAALPEHITHVRWIINSINSGESGSVYYVATVR